MKKARRLIALCAVMGMLLAFSVSADPYQNYVYNNNGVAQAEPQAYVPSGRITGESLGCGSFAKPKNLFVTEDGHLYITDTDNNRLVVLNSRFELERVIDSFDNNGQSDTFCNPQAVFIHEDELYVADTGNARIVVLDPQLKAVRVLGRPQSALLSEEFSYQPIDLCVDSAGRIFVVSQNVNDGVMELTAQGEFVGFMGAVKVKMSVVQALWRAIATKEQRERMQLYLPTEYAAVDIDSSGFLYCTVSAIDEDNYAEEMFICRLNPMGNDVLKRNGFQAPMGDIEVRLDVNSLQSQYSALVDVAVQDCGIYSVLDQRMGRVFTYNSNGELMYVFGALGNNAGQFGMPEAIDTMPDGRILVVDSVYNWIAVFEPTDYGRIITEAVKTFYNRQYEQTDQLWSQALQYTAKSDLAFDGIGRSLMKNGEYEKAMEYLKVASDRPNYSSAFEKYRSAVLDSNFNWILIAVAAILILIFGIKAIRKYRDRKGR